MRNILKLQFLVIVGIMLSSSFVLGAYDPNDFDEGNAAHWYRKAFALYEEPEGIDPSEYVIRFRTS